MFSYHIEQFGQYERHVLAQAATGTRFSFVPEIGGILLDVTFGDFCVTEHYETPEALTEMAWAKGILLYPYPNRMRDGRYVWEGKTYQFPLNNAVTGNSIHGVGKRAPMQLKSYMVTETFASATLVFTHDGAYDYYPFAYDMEVTYMISSTGHFDVEMQFRNKSEATIPVGLGWHPYFKISENIADTSIQTPVLTKVEVDERLLPNGIKMPFEDFVTLQKINETDVDNCFLIQKSDEKEAIITLQSDSGTLKYWQQIGEQKFNFVQIFTLPSRTCIALEPMTCNVDAFNNHEGLVSLAPNETLGGEFGFSWTKA